jgi:hypothetical protein
MSRLLAELSHLSVLLLIKLSIPWNSVQLTVTLGPPSCSFILLLWLEDCYFCERPIGSHAPFTSLLLIYPTHPKWSHLCHCSPFITNKTAKTTKPNAAMRGMWHYSCENGQISFFLFSNAIWSLSRTENRMHAFMQELGLSFPRGLKRFCF